MHITINTAEELSDLDKSILRTLLGHSAPSSAPATVAEAEAKPEKPAPAKKKKVATKPAPEPELEEEEEEEEEEEATNDGAPSMEDAVSLATKLVNGGRASDVKAALAEAGCKRVSELDESDIASFVEALS